MTTLHSSEREKEALGTCCRQRAGMSADLDEMLSMLGVSDTKEEAATKETKDEAPAAADAPADAPVESSTGPATRPARPPPPKTLADAEARQGTTYKVRPEGLRASHARPP